MHTLIEKHIKKGDQLRELGSHLDGTVEGMSYRIAACIEYAMALGIIEQENCHD